MAKTLVIVESPAKARTIERILKGGYEVLASYGHFRDLPESADYASGRTQYVKSGGGTPPAGATPIGD